MSNPVHEGVTFDRLDEYAVMDCVPCGFVHLWPMPEIDYADDYYTKEKPDFIASQEKEWEWWMATFSDRLEILENFSPKDRRLILDVGCGPGTFLKVAEERGWSAVGVEPNRTAYLYAKKRGLDVIHSQFTGKILMGKLFSAIHMNEVLEHVPYPKAFLQLAWFRLSKGGLICVSVPNDYNNLQRLLRTNGHSPWWLHKTHNNYFTPQSLQALMESCGFEVFRQHTSFPMELFLLLGFNYVDDPALGKDCHERRQGFDLMLGNLRSALYGELAKAGIGREITLYGRKI